MKTEYEVKIRRLRKKLRQIENLERLDRVLTAEEQLKVSRKSSLRSQLLELLSLLSEDGSTSIITSTSVGGAGDTDLLTDMSQDDSSWYEDHDEVKEECEEHEISCPQSVTDEEKMKRLAESGQSTADTGLSEKNTNSSSPAKRYKTEANSDSEQPTREKQETKVFSEPKKQPAVNAFRELQKRWLATEWHISILQGHNDLVCSVSILGCWLLTGSRDTTVKLWDISNAAEVRSMGGHTGSVTCVKILTPEQAHVVLSQLAVESDGSEMLIGLSASQDCYIKIWNLSAGAQIKSIYTFSPVTKLTFDVFNKKPCLLSGSAGGKVELWDIESGTPSSSVRAHDDSVTGLQVADDGHVYSCSADGVINVFQIRDSELRVIFVSENVKLASGIPIKWRCIRSLAVYNQTAYLGDDAMNIKVLDWKNGAVHKLSNHTTEFGATDALYVADDLHLLLASGYDLDNGLGFINIRHLPDEKYLCSLCDDRSSRIVSLQCAPVDPDDPDGKNVMIVTAGMELCLWRQITKAERHQYDNLHKTQYVSQFSRQARHSDAESDVDADVTDDDDDDDDRDAVTDDDGDDNSEMSPPFVRRSSSSASAAGSSWISWCAIL